MSSSTSVTAKHASRPFRVGSDGLPLLPCHDVRVTVAFAEAARAPPPPPRAVSAFGSVDSPAAVRRQLEALYARTQQLPALSEATLRADTELELLRRQCFAQRNAQWGYTTPDQLEFRPHPHAQWTPQPANAKLALRQAKIDGALDKELAFSAADGARGQDQPLRPVRDRPWPPAEFALKTVAKPARGRGGKRKAAPMAAVLDPVPLLARTCRECSTQSTPLWRSQTKEQTPVDAQQAQAATPTPTAPQKLDLCLQCYLKLERADLFDKKRVEKRREERRKKEQAAAAALQEKKRLKHQIHTLKKQQKQEAQLAADDEQLMGGQVPQEQDQEEEAPVILKFTREEIEAATGSSKERKKDRKTSRKDKKKKKKHRRKHEMEVESDSDGPTPIPSPAQMNGYVYADRAPEPYTTPQTSVFTVDHAESARHTEALVVETEPEALDGSDDRGFNEEDDMASTPARSSRKRKSVQRAEPVVVEESPSSASKKRKTSSSRPSRSKRSAASAPPAPVVVAVPPAPIVKKRARTKKELARERELRALGQYCPVCSEVYEDDDQNTFVCCDSCELWVHGACDPSLTPELIAAMANTEDKYICPLCAGR